MKFFIFTMLMLLGTAQNAYSFSCVCDQQDVTQSYCSGVDQAGAPSCNEAYNYLGNQTGKANQYCIYKCNNNYCPTTTRPTSYTYGFNGTERTLNYCSACQGPNCPDLKLSKTFDFNVLSGGVNANMYVCEVGFYRICPTCDQHYLQISYNDGSTTTLSDEKIKTFKTFNGKETLVPVSANVYINDLYWGAEFYVKYCVGADRQVVGTDATGTTFEANIKPSYKIETGSFGTASGYVEGADLHASLYKDCTSNAVIPGYPAQGALVGTAIDLTTEGTVTSALGTDTLELCGTPGCKQKQCVYTLRFNEAATCYRLEKCAGPGCESWGSTIKTTFNADVSFDCVDGVCGN